MNELPEGVHKTPNDDDWDNGDWIDCWNCGGEGYSHHDCGEDTCCCLYPEDNVRCDVCNGRGGWPSAPEARVTGSSGAVGDVDNSKETS